MTSLISFNNLPRPLPGIGYAMNMREYASYALSLDTDPNDNFAMRGGKTLVNTAIRCTSYSIPYLSYASWPYPMYASQYINIGLAAGKGVYAGYLYYLGYTENDNNKKTQAKEIALQALGHGLFAYGDNLATALRSKSIVPIITAYVGIGAFTDILGKSKKMHSKLFGHENRRVGNNDSDSDSDYSYSSASSESDTESYSESVSNSNSGSEEIGDRMGTESFGIEHFDSENSEDGRDSVSVNGFSDDGGRDFDIGGTSDDEDSEVAQRFSDIGVGTPDWGGRDRRSSTSSRLSRRNSSAGSASSLFNRTFRVSFVPSHPSRARKVKGGMRLRSYKGPERPNYRK